MWKGSREMIPSCFVYNVHKRYHRMLDAVHIKPDPVVSKSQPPPAAARSTYRHGDLRRALILAGVELARADGPDAVVLREATRRVGVVPNAAYRHFESRQALLLAVKDEALLAAGLAMRAEVEASAATGTRRERARAAVRAVGRAYLRFAQTETGLFRTAFGPIHAEPDAAAGLQGSAPGPLHPFRLLGDALDQLVAAGALPEARRPNAEFLAWAAVHGMALLLIDGPLRGASEPQVEGLTVQLLAMVERGL
ncbi:Transcriptional regulator, TetR family [Burkholderiales bacterium 8X]|nr:Transcriptional regulator, TetR family [Burkholderiales bacterium 8X]